MDPDQLYRLMRTRHTVRRFLDQPVPREILSRVLWAGTRAPSAHNRQPWRFVVVERGDSRRRWVERMGARYRQDLSADGVPSAKVEQHVSRREARLMDAPAAIVLCMTTEEMDEYPDPVRQRNERTMAVQSVALAGGHMLLAAHAEGLGACWMCAPLFGDEETVDTLGLEPEWEPQGVLIMGYPAGEPRIRSRRELDQVVVRR